jgi:DNA-dependent RNA polymerase auxiliary subunit epsilon
MKVKRLTKILFYSDDDVEIYIEDLVEKDAKYNIEFIEKKESIYTDVYGKNQSLKILLKEKRK